MAMPRARAPRKTPMAAVNAKPVGSEMGKNIAPRVNPRATPGMGPSPMTPPAPPPSPPGGGTARAGMLAQVNAQRQARASAPSTPQPEPRGEINPVRYDSSGMGIGQKAVGKGGKATLTQRLAAKAGHKSSVGKGQKANPFAKMKQESKASEKAEKKAGKDNKREEAMEVGKGAKNPFKSKSASMKRTKPGIAIAIKMGTGKPKGFPSSDKRGTKGMRGGNNKPPFPIGGGQKSKSKKSSKAYY